MPLPTLSSGFARKPGVTNQLSLIPLKVRSSSHFLHLRNKHGIGMGCSTVPTPLLFVHVVGLVELAEL